MKELIETIGNVQRNLFENMVLALQGNKAAGVRARKNTLELERLYKQYRKESIEAAKK